MKIILGIFLILAANSCASGHPAYRKVASQAPGDEHGSSLATPGPTPDSVIIRTVDGAPVTVPRSEIDRVNDESCPKCDRGLVCNPTTKQCERQD